MQTQIYISITLNVNGLNMQSKEKRLWTTFKKNKNKIRSNSKLSRQDTIKLNRRYPDWKGRSKTISVGIVHNLIDRKS